MKAAGASMEKPVCEYRTHPAGATGGADDSGGAEDGGAADAGSPEAGSDDAPVLAGLHPPSAPAAATTARPKAKPAQWLNGVE